MYNVETELKDYRYKSITQNNKDMVLWYKLCYDENQYEYGVCLTTQESQDLQTYFQNNPNNFDKIEQVGCDKENAPKSNMYHIFTGSNFLILKKIYQKPYEIQLIPQHTYNLEFDIIGVVLNNS